MGFILVPIGAGKGWKVVKAAPSIARPVGGVLLRQAGKRIHNLQGNQFRNPLAAWQTYDSLETWGNRTLTAMRIVDLVEGSSSETYQQNGGPLTPTLDVTDDWRESLGDPSPISQGKPRRKLRGRSRPRCPPGHRWNGRFCVPILRIDDDMKRFHDKWYRS